MGRRPDLGGLDKKLRRCDAFAALQTLAALQLVPENVERVLRLEAAAVAAASAFAHQPKPDPNMKLGQLATLLARDRTLSGLAVTEDPLPGQVCQEVLFVGHGHLVLPGQDPAGVFTLELLTRTLFLHPGAREIPGVEAAKNILQACLTLSHEVCSRAGISRGAALVQGARGPIHFPNASVIDRLVRAVTFSEVDVAALVRRNRLTEQGLAAMMVDVSRIDPRRFDPDDNALQTRPLVRGELGVVVAHPFALCAAGVKAAVRAIQDAEGMDVLRRCFEQSVVIEMDTVIEGLGLTPVARVKDTPPGIDLFVTTSDVDKAVILACISDTDTRDDDSGEQWDLEGQLAAMLNELTTKVLPFRPSPSQSDLTLLVVTQRLHRDAIAAVPKVGDSRVDRVQWLALEELSVMADVINGDWNRLHYFLEDVDALKKRAKVFVWSILDLFELWRGKDDSFYMGDEAKSSGFVVVLSTEGEGELRRATANMIDRHAIDGYESGSVVEVQRFYRTLAIPIRVPGRQEYPALAVEVGDCLIWVTAPVLAPELGQSVEPPLAEMFVYWFWRIRHALGPALGSLGISRLVITVGIREAAVWAKLMLGEDVEAEESLVEVQRVCEGSLDVAVLPGFVRASALRDDTEFDLVIAVLDALEAVGPDEAHSLFDQARQALRTWSDTSNCRMLSTFKTDLEMDPRRLMAPHSVQSSFTDRILDDLGRRIAEQGTLAAPLTDPDAISDLLLKMVDVLYQRLKSEVAQCRSDLLEQLVCESESQLFNTRMEEQRLEHSHACFSDVDDTIERHATQIPKRATAAIAARFLLEYVAAVPPNGTARGSHTRMEGLLTLASVLTDYAHEAELARVGLGPTSAEPLPSGRVGLKRQAHVRAARIDYIKDLVRIQVAPEPDDVGSPTVPTQDDMDAAMTAEFGIGLGTFLDTFAGLSDLAFAGPTPYGQMGLDEFVDNITAALKVERTTAETFVDTFSLCQRMEFETPPPGHGGGDLWPWRFGRSYSYIARPLVRREGPDGPVIIWGPRNVFSSARHTVMQIAMGRFQGKSDAMKSLKSRLNHMRGEQFADHVVSMVGRLADVGIHSRFKGVRSLRMPQALGDIDVLVVDRRHGVVWAIECKSFAMTLVPADLQNDMRELRKASGKQQARAVWLEENVQGLREPLGLGEQQFVIKPLIVLAALQLSSYVMEVGVPVTHVDGLLDLLGGATE